LSLSLQGCIFHGTALHELGHTIGLNHEQCRNDRDKRIQVLFDNVEPRYKYAFNIESGQSDFGIPYDYCSIMQYGPTAFSKNREFTVLARDFDYQWSLGWHQFNAEGLTFSDAKVVNLMYKCNAHCPADTTCKSPCYVNHKCRCECEKSLCKKFACESRTSKSKCDSISPMFFLLRVHSFQTSELVLFSFPLHSFLGFFRGFCFCFCFFAVFVLFALGFVLLFDLFWVFFRGYCFVFVFVFVSVFVFVFCSFFLNRFRFHSH